MPAVRVCVQLFPLLEELELHVLLEFHVEVELPAVVVKRKAPMHADILRPFLIGRAAEEGLDGHEQRIIRQPPSILLHEALIRRIMADVAALIGQMQQREAAFVELVKVHALLPVAKVRRVAFRLRQHALLDQRLQADQVGIARKGGIRLVGRIAGFAVARRPQRQNLPIALARLREPIHKVVGAFRKAADAVFPRQAGHGEQHARSSVHSNIPFRLSRRRAAHARSVAGAPV